ncbi:sensor histidine kinase [Antarcticirhabdus aurantiaca]|uniref:GAF domain-containing protein n=1 Tax=Antarcticirhabdus aurantiaca TaxID=2606717 RepID=A0ACD4NWG4_9HYPH|nr:HWE histidine kinase domain-containing protein [Antarcticirhabdus aurantiaca]WAJ31217.1 GAF domain-containing protein [Jeongeuplla avenae]
MSGNACSDAASLPLMAAEAGFERVTRLAVRLLDVPTAYVSLVDETHVHVKSHIGLPPDMVAVGQFPLAASICRHVVAEQQPVAIRDILADPRTSGVETLRDSGIRAYLGVPVFDAMSGEACVLCAVDYAPRDWSPQQRAILSDLADMLRTELDLRAEIVANAAVRERNILMIREMEHRVKNSLSTVQAIVAMSLKGHDVPEDLRRALLDRVASLAQTHNLLLAGEGATTTFDALLDAELRHYRADEMIRVKGPSVRIIASEAVTVGMVLHELATNAAKYGALAQSGEGRLDVAWNEVPTSLGDRRLRIEWQETVPRPLVDPARRNGFGTTLLETLIVHQQGGTIDRRWEPAGLSLTAEFDLARA